MVRKISDKGGVYHEPPYTEEEELELYRRMDAGPFARIIPAPASTPQPRPQKAPPPQEER